MDSIIHQITTELVEKILKKAKNLGQTGISQLSADVLQDCEEAARQILQEVIRDLNLSIREDKAGRKELGLTLKEKDRSRTLLTRIGTLQFQRDLYLDTHAGTHVYPIDHILDVEKYARVDGLVRASLVTQATQVSYAKSASLVTDDAVSRQTVRNSIRRMTVPEKEPAWPDKKVVPALHVYADEDHVHMQKPGKAPGKKMQMVPLVTVTEGSQKNGKRTRTLCPMHFVDEDMDGAALWKQVEGYIEKAYAVSEIQTIYVHGDGGAWIKSGLEEFAQKKAVLDGFHLEKYVKKISHVFPKKNLRVRFEKAFEDNDRKRADRILQELYGEAEGDAKRTEAVKEFGRYIQNNWDGIVRRKTLTIPGSCTEGQVSHVLSERFSRDPMGWSREVLGKLSRARVYIKNGGELEGKEFRHREADEEKEKAKERERAAKRETYVQYAERMLKEATEGAYDWSVFEKPRAVFDGASGTQTLLRAIGQARNIV